MNATSRKVLLKVLMGFIIMEPDMRRSRIRRRRCPEMKRVSGRSRLVLRCHAQTIRKKEKERHAEEYQSTIISNRKKRMVRMHEKCINI